MSQSPDFNRLLKKKRSLILTRTTQITETNFSNAGEEGETLSCKLWPLWLNPRPRLRKEAVGGELCHRVQVAWALGSERPKLKSTFCASLSDLLNPFETVFSSKLL